MSDLQKLAKLAKLSAMVRDQKQMALSSLRQQETRLRAMMADLDPAPVEDPIAIFASADVRYAIWAERRRVDLNKRIARNLAEQEKVKPDVAKAVGRVSVIDELRETLKADLRRKKP